MMNRLLKKVVGILLSVCIILMPLSVMAEEPGKVENDEVNMVSCDMFEEILPEAIEMGDINNITRPFWGENLSVTNVIGGATAYTVSENTDPNNAYIAVNGNAVQANLSQVGETRWYGFILEEKSKVTIVMESVDSVDADLYLFSLQDTNQLFLVGASTNGGLGSSEKCCYILEPGIYYFAVGAYEGNGNYAFVFYATQDLNYEENDSKNTAAVINVDSIITGVLDNPFDLDYYIFTLTSPAIVNLTKSIGDYKFDFIRVDENATVYKVSQRNEWYKFTAGTFCFVVHSEDNSYDINKSYEINMSKIADISDNIYSDHFMVNEPAKIVFQCDQHGKNMYVNGNEVDINYHYYFDSTNPAGTQSHNISMENDGNVQAFIYIDTDISEATLPNTVYYIRGSRGSGDEKIHVLELFLFSAEPFYRINCRCTGAYAEDDCHVQMQYASVFINPNNGKLVDISSFNYFYDFASGTNSMTYTRPYSHLSTCLYGYIDGKRPTVW